MKTILVTLAVALGGAAHCSMAATISLTQNYDDSSAPVVGQDYVTSITTSNEDSTLAGGITAQPIFVDDEYLSFIGPNGARNGELIYTFTAPEGEVFDGNFTIDVKMGARGSSTTWGIVQLWAKGGSEEDYTQLAEASTYVGPNQGTEGTVTFENIVSYDATKESEVIVKFYLGKRFFADYSQLAYAKFDGATTVIPESSFSALGLGLLATVAVLTRRRFRCRG